MDVGMIALAIAGSAALGIVVWVLAKLGTALIKIAETLAAARAFLRKGSDPLPGPRTHTERGLD